jgi:hypothetical protein
MNESMIVVVILKALSGQPDAEALETARARLEKWAGTHAVEVLPVATRDPGALQFAYVRVSDAERAAEIEKLLAKEPFVDAAYRKPPDEPAGIP